MPNGFGSRGEIEVRRHEGDEIADARRVAVLGAEAADVVVCIAFGLTALFWMRASGVRHWWIHLRDWAYLLWLTLLALPWVAMPAALLTWYLLPKLRNVNWPPPFAQLDAADADAPITWADSRQMPMVDGREVAEPAVVQREVVWRVEGSLNTGNGQSIHDHPVLTDAPAWHRFCQAVAFEGRNFSQTEAVRRNSVPLADWETMHERFTTHGWLAPAGERGTPELSDVGAAWVNRYASVPPPYPVLS